MQVVFVYSALMLNELARKCRETSNSKGFFTDWTNVNTKLLLVHCEISEAAEEVRAGRRNEVYYSERNGKPKPEGFAMEVADAIIRLLELSDSLGLNIEGAVAEKMAYNEGRPYLHGKLY